MKIFKTKKIKNKQKKYMYFENLSDENMTIL